MHEFSSGNGNDPKKEEDDENFDFVEAGDAVDETITYFNYQKLPQEVFRGEIDVEIANNSEFSEQEKQALESWLDFLFSDRGELKHHLFQAFVEKCDQLQIDSVALQEKLMSLLEQSNVARLYWLVPKGSRVKVTSQVDYDGDLVNNWREGFDRKVVDKVGHIYDPEQEVVLNGQEFTARFPGDRNPYLEIERGIVLSEIVAGYDCLLGLLDSDNGEIQMIWPDDIASFAIESIDSAEAVYRPRELYFGREIALWDSKRQRWHKGRVGPFIGTSRRGTKQFVDLDTPETKLDILGRKRPNRTRSFISERDAVYDDVDGLPLLGSRSIETTAWKYPEIAFFPQDQEHDPYQDVPACYKPESIIVENDGFWEIDAVFPAQYEVGMFNGQTHNYAKVNYAHLSDDELPQNYYSLVPEKQDLLESKVRLNIDEIRSLSGRSSLPKWLRPLLRIQRLIQPVRSNDSVFIFKGVYDHQGEKVVILKPTGKVLNEPNFKEEFLIVPMAAFELAQSVGSLEVANSQKAEKLAKLIVDPKNQLQAAIDAGQYIGSIIARVRLAHGEVYGEISLSKFPFALVYKAVANSREEFEAQAQSIYFRSQPETSFSQMDAVQAIEIDEVVAI